MPFMLPLLFMFMPFVGRFLFMRFMPMLMLLLMLMLMPMRFMLMPMPSQKRLPMCRCVLMLLCRSVFPFPSVLLGLRVHATWRGLMPSAGSRPQVPGRLALAAEARFAS